MKILFALVLTMTALRAESVDVAYRKQIQEYRQNREAALKADGGWLTVKGLFWLKEGENTLGSDTSNDIVLPESAPAHFGTITLDHGAPLFHAASGAVKLNGQAVKEIENPLRLTHPRCNQARS